MKNRIFLISAILTAAILTTSCGERISVSNMDVEKLSKKAYELMQEGDVEGAIGRLEAVNDLNPNLAENHYNLGIAYYQTGKYDKAIKSLETSIELKKNQNNDSNILAMKMNEHKNMEVYGLKDAYYTLAVIHEEQALEGDKELAEVKGDEEKMVNALVKTTQSYKKARENYAEYINLIESGDENDQLTQKLSEFDKKLEENTGILTELGLIEEK